MFKFLFLMLCLSGAQQLKAQSTSNDFSRSNSKGIALSTDDIRNRFELYGKIYVTDLDGKLLYQGNEVRMWKFGSKGDLISNWSFKAPGIKDLALKQVWSLSKGGQLNAHIQQFTSMERKGDTREVIMGSLVREEKIEIKDFAPVNWVAHVDSKQKVIIRLTPELGEKPEYIEIDNLPVTLTNPVVFDNKGRFWAQAHDLEGRYLSMKTHLGQLALSFTDFKGAKEIGFVKGNEITMNGDKDLKVFIKSDAPILATINPAKIYGILDQNKKTERVNSLNSSSSSNEKEFLKHID